MKGTFAAAFVGITLSGEIYIIRQKKGTLDEVQAWIKEQTSDVAKLYGYNFETIILKDIKTLRHKPETSCQSQ